MPAAKKIRKLEIFSLHALNDDGPVDYHALFALLAGLPATERRISGIDRVIAVPRLTQQGDSAFLVAIEGAAGANPLIFDYRTAEERTGDLKPSELVAEKTHALINLSTREAVVEYNFHGAKAAQIAEVLEAVGRTIPGWESLSIQLNPKPDGEFLQAIERFDRIQAASVRVARPNQDWTDHHNRLMDLADASNAHTAEVSLSAGRTQSLSKNNGIIQIIRQLACAGLSSLKTVSIKGLRQGEKAPTVISLKHYIEHQKVDVRLDEDGHVRESDIKSKMREFLDARRSES